MRNIVYKDTRIKDSEYRQLLDSYTRYLEDTAGLKPIFWTVDYVFTDYPTVIDTDGDDVMRPDFLQNIAKEVTAKYGDYGTDNVITLIHESNWKSGKTATRKGIWGTNYSYRFGKYHVQYCRFDEGNLANSLATMIHENIWHPADALTQVEIGIDLNKIAGVSRWDAEIVHGENPKYRYVRRINDNEATLKLVAPYLQAAYQKRLERHTEAVRGMKITIIGLLEKVVGLLKQRKHKK